MSPYRDITFACVVWNDAKRLRPLLEKVRPYFATLAVVVQDSPDDTLAVAQELADIVVTDRHHGYGDASFGPLLLPQIRTTWTLKLDADEWPSDDLLENLHVLVDAASAAKTRGVWVPFRSWVEGEEYTEYHGHLRLFHTAAGWPGTLHSRPPIEDAIGAEVGHIAHRRTLDEMMQDYLRYWDAGRGNPGWDAHNRLMMHDACLGTARVKGWDFVQSFPWWPRVEAVAFATEKPWLEAAPSPTMKTLT